VDEPANRSRITSSLRWPLARSTPRDRTCVGEACISRAKNRSAILVSHAVDAIEDQAAVARTRAGRQHGAAAACRRCNTSDRCSPPQSPHAHRGHRHCAQRSSQAPLGWAASRPTNRYGRFIYRPVRRSWSHPSRPEPHPQGQNQHMTRRAGPSPTSGKNTVSIFTSATTIIAGSDRIQGRQSDSSDQSDIVAAPQLGISKRLAARAQAGAFPCNPAASRNQ
jgi:hypothetical protein